MNTLLHPHISDQVETTVDHVETTFLVETIFDTFLIFGKSDGWWSETFSHGDGANVDPAARLVCVALGSWRLVSRNGETSHESEVRMRDSAEKLLGRFAPHFLLYCTSLVA